MCFKTRNIFCKRIRYFFVFLHIVFCLDFGFVDRPNIKRKITVLVLTFFNLFFTISLNFINLVIEGEDASIIVWVITVAAVNIYNVLVLSCNQDKSFCNALKALFSIDSKLMTEKTYTSFSMDAKIIVSWFVHLLCSLVLISIYCSVLIGECIRSYLSAVLTVTQLTSLNTVFIICFFMLYSVYCRMKIFVEFVRNSDEKILDCLNMYRGIVDVLDNIKKLFAFLVSIQLSVIQFNIVIEVFNLNIVFYCSILVR